MLSGFQASDIGQYGIDDLSWWQGPGGYDTAPAGWSTPGAGTQSPFFTGVPVLDALGQFVAPFIEQFFKQPRESVPEIRTTLPGGEAPIPVGESAGGPILVPSGPSGAVVINPEYRPSETVYENAPGGIYEVERQPTDWDAYYRAYVELNKEEEEPVFDWLATGITDIAQVGQNVGWWGGSTAPAAPAPAGYPSMAPGGAAAMPAKVTVDTRTGKVTTCKRRRRRKLLTESDFNVLLRVATLPNKENVRIVLGKAIGRS